MIYDLHHRYLFIHIPRTAGVAITRALAGVSSHCVVDLTAGRHMTAAVLKKRLADRWDQFRPWAVARSPWDIVLSDYRLTLRDLQVGALQARLAPGWRGRLERMRDEPGFEAFVHREICDPRYSRMNRKNLRFCTLAKSLRRDNRYECNRNFFELLRQKVPCFDQA